MFSQKQSRDPTSPLFRGYRGLFTQQQSCRCVKLTTHTNQVPRLRMCGATPLFPLHAFTAWSGQLYLCLIFLFVHIFLKPDSHWGTFYDALRNSRPIRLRMAPEKYLKRRSAHSVSPKNLNFFKILLRFCMSFGSLFIFYWRTLLNTGVLCYKSEGRGFDSRCCH